MSFLLNHAFSGEHFKDSRKPMIWYKFKKIFNGDTNKLFWQPQEVRLDMHDNPQFNRRFVKLDHTLVIKDFQPGKLDHTLVIKDFQPGKLDLTLVIKDFQPGKISVATTNMKHVHNTTVTVFS